MKKYKTEIKYISGITTFIFGFLSNDNSSLVANIQNLTTGYISPQYHIVFKKLFRTVCGTWEYEAVTDAISNRLSKKTKIGMLKKILY